jgi:hypothetical protein
VLTGAAAFGTAGSAAAATPAPSIIASQASAAPGAPPHWCPGGRHWRERWWDRRGWWDRFHHWHGGRWHPAGCW